MNRTLWVYIIGSNTGTLYTGMTNSLDRRVRQQKAGEIDGLQHVRCNRLLYYESFDDPRDAIIREKQIKGWTRAKKIALIEVAGPCRAFGMGSPIPSREYRI